MFNLDMLIKLKDGREVKIGKVQSEGIISRVIINGKKVSRHQINSYILTAFYNSKKVASFNVTRPVTAQGIRYSKHVGEMGYFVARGFRSSGLSYYMVYYMAKSVLKRGIKIILINTIPSNKASITLFSRSGGKKVGLMEKVLKINKKYVDSLWMESTTENVIKNSRKMWEKKGVKEVKF
jgi:L-amino acid N-acyltransferase YncA